MLLLLEIMTICHIDKKLCEDGKNTWTKNHFCRSMLQAEQERHISSRKMALIGCFTIQ